MQGVEGYVYWPAKDFVFHARKFEANWEESFDYIRRILNYDARVRGILSALYINTTLCVLVKKGDESKITNVDCVVYLCYSYGKKWCTYICSRFS